MMTSDWAKSSYSGGSTGSCVECRSSPSRALIRDTQNRHLGHIDYTPGAWVAFLVGVRGGEL